MKNLKTLFKYLKPYKKWLFLAPLFLTFELIMDIFLPAIFGNVINFGALKGNMNYIINSIILMLFLTIIGGVGGIFSVYYGAKASEYAANDLRNELFNKITSLNLLNLRKYETGHFVTVLTNDINLIANIIMVSLRIFIRVPIIIIGSTIMAILMSPKLSLILIFAIPFLAVITFILIKKVFPKFLEIQTGVDTISSKVREGIGGIKTLKSLAKEESEQKKFNQINLKLKNTNIKANLLLNLQAPTTTLLINVCIILVLYFGGNSILKGENIGVSIGTILAFIQYLTNILYALVQASAVIVMLSKSEVSVLRVKEILNLNSTIQNGEKVEQVNQIELKDVFFDYGGKSILKNINLTIKKGQIIGITGLTGSGKSTLISLINKSILPKKGKIYINDYELDKVDIIGKISTAYQEPLLFSESIRKNLKYSKDVSDTKMRQYAKLCEADEFILHKKGAYDFKLSSKGLNLSGGQRQRIALTRAVLADADVLILDDAISSLDANTENKILDNFRKKLNDKIIILVSSKTNTLMNCDKVLVLNNGQIDAFEKPEKLKESNQIFKDMSIGGDTYV